MSLCSLIIAPRVLDSLPKDRYHKHTLIYIDSSRCIYGRMGGGVLSPEGKMLPSYYHFLLALRPLASPIFVVIDELRHHQGEEDLAQAWAERLGREHAREWISQDRPLQLGKLYRL